MASAKAGTPGSRGTRQRNTQDAARRTSDGDSSAASSLLLSFEMEQRADTTDARSRAGCRLRQSCPPGGSAIAKPPGGTVIASFASVATSTSRDSSSKSPRLS